MSMKKVLGLVSFGMVLVSAAVGCGGGPIDPPSSLELSGDVQHPKATMSRTCGSEGQHTVVSYTAENAERCGDTVTVNGVPAKGTRAFSAEDGRWSLGFTIPAGATSGPVVVKCGGEEVVLGKLDVPCNVPPSGGNEFAQFSGELQIARGCDDADGKVTLSDFTPTTFTMTGLSGNGPITFTVQGNEAKASGVVQYGKPGHEVTLVIDGASIRFLAQSSEGSCTTTLAR